MKRKKCAVILLGAVILAASVTIGIVMAALTARTEHRVNKFTFGNANIDLTEEKWDILTSEEKIVYPNRKITKDPKVTNTGETDLYIFIEVQIPCASVQTLENENLNPADWHELFSYNVNDGWELIEASQNADKTVAIKVYAYTKKVLSPHETTGSLFDSVTYLNIVEGQLKAGDGLSMPISAYAIQADYLNEQGTSVKEKMIDAYSKYKTEVNKR